MPVGLVQSRLKKMVHGCSGPAATGVPCVPWKNWKWFTSRIPGANAGSGWPASLRVFCLVALVPKYGLIDLETLLGWANPDYVWVVPLESSWGSRFTFIIGSALGFIALRPARSRTALVQLAAVTGTLLLCSLLWWGQGPWWVGLTVGVVIAVLA